MTIRDRTPLSSAPKTPLFSLASLPLPTQLPTPTLSLSYFRLPIINSPFVSKPPSNLLVLLFCIPPSTTVSHKHTLPFFPSFSFVPSGAGFQSTWFNENLSIMSAFFYNHQQHQQHHPQHGMQSATHHNHHGRSRRAPKMTQNARQFRGVKSMRELAEAPAMTAFRARFEAGRSFDLDDDLEFCPGLLTEDDVCLLARRSS